MDSRLLLLVMVVPPLGLVVAVLTARAWREQRRVNLAQRWPQTPGRVISSGVQEVAVRRRRSTSVSSYYLVTRYAPQVIYEYVVDGARHQAERLSIGSTFVSSEAGDAEREAARYPVGGQVTVYYDPMNPAETTLDPRTGGGTQALWLIAGLVLIITLVLIVVILT